MQYYGADWKKQKAQLLRALQQKPALVAVSRETWDRLVMDYGPQGARLAQYGVPIVVDPNVMGFRVTK